MRIPQWALENSGASASESIIVRSAAFVPVPSDTGLGAVDGAQAVAASNKETR
jgi:hypothetical protein